MNAFYIAFCCFERLSEFVFWIDWADFDTGLAGSVLRDKITKDPQAFFGRFLSKYERINGFVDSLKEAETYAAICRRPDRGIAENRMELVRFVEHGLTSEGHGTGIVYRTYYTDCR